eukprot:5477401-Prymnesium_polylepis.1
MKSSGHSLWSPGRGNRFDQSQMQLLQQAAKPGPSLRSAPSPWKCNHDRPSSPTAHITDGARQDTRTERHATGTSEPTTSNCIVISRKFTDAPLGHREIDAETRLCSNFKFQASATCSYLGKRGVAGMADEFHR